MNPQVNWIRWWFWCKVKRLRKGKGNYPIWTGLSSTARFTFADPESRSPTEYYKWINDEE